MARKKSVTTIQELSEAVAEDYRKQMEMAEMTEATKKKICTLHMDFILPIPIYKDVVTVGEPDSKNVCRVKEINWHESGIEVVALEGKKWVIPLTKVRYMIEEE